MTNMFPIFLCFLFITRYWGNSNPPLDDIISPLITLSMIAKIFISYNLHIITSTISMGLIFELLADYNMSLNLRLPIKLFSLGHLIRQTIFIINSSKLNTDTFSIIQSYNLLSLSIYIFSLLLLIKLIFGDYLKPFTLIFFYSLIIFFSFLQASLLSISYGYIIYITSDLIIGYEMVFGTIIPRQIRVILVPILYWLAQYILIQETLLQ